MGRSWRWREYPVYLVEIQVHNAPQVESLHLQVSGPAAAGWHVTSSALAPADGSAYAARLPTSSFPAGPDGFTALPDLPTLPPGSWTTLRGIVYSSDEDMCFSEWVRASPATLRPVMLSENQRTMTYFMVGGDLLRALVTGPRRAARPRVAPAAAPQGGCAGVPSLAPRRSRREGPVPSRELKGPCDPGAIRASRSGGSVTPKLLTGLVRPARFERATYRFVARAREDVDHHQDTPSATKDRGATS